MLENVTAPVPALRVRSPPSVTGPVNDAPALVKVMLPSSVTAPEPLDVRPVSAVCPPTAPPKVVVPVLLRLRTWAPSTVPAKSTAPTPDVMVRAPPRVVAPLTEIEPPDTVVAPDPVVRAVSPVKPLPKVVWPEVVTVRAWAPLTAPKPTAAEPALTVMSPPSVVAPSEIAPVVVTLPSSVAAPPPVMVRELLPFSALVAPTVLSNRAPPVLLMVISKTPLVALPPLTAPLKSTRPVPVLRVIPDALLPTVIGPLIVMAPLVVVTLPAIAVALDEVVAREARPEDVPPKVIRPELSTTRACPPPVTPLVKLIEPVPPLKVTSAPRVATTLGIARATPEVLPASVTLPSNVAPVVEFTVRLVSEVPPPTTPPKTAEGPATVRLCAPSTVPLNVTPAPLAVSVTSDPSVVGPSNVMPPELVVMFAETVVPRLGPAVGVLPAPSKVRPTWLVMLTALVTAMELLAARMTLEVAASRVAVLMVMDEVVSEVSAPSARVSEPVEAMVMLAGSSSQSPARPLGARVFTVAPSATVRPCLPEVST